MQKPVLDFWFDFASVYSFLASMRIAPLADDAGVTVRWRPFLLGPIFAAQGMTDSPFNLFPVKGKHMIRDVQRSAEEIGVGFRWPDAFPQSAVLASRRLIGLKDSWGRISAAFHTEAAENRVISEHGDRRHPDKTKVPWTPPRRHAGRGHQGGAAREHGGGSDARFRSADLHHRQWRKRATTGLEALRWPK